MTTNLKVRTIAALLSVVAAAGCTDLADATGIAQQNVTVTPSVTTAATYQVNEAISVDFDGFEGAATDWIALATPGSDDTAYLDYRFTTGGTAGSVTFGTLPVGTYEARAYFNWEETQSYDRQATTTFSVVAVGVVPISTDSTHYAIGAPVTVSYSEMPATSTDWVGIAVPGTPATAWIRFLFTDGNASGEVTFNNLPAGTYVARSFRENSYDMVAESAPFTIGNVIETSQPSYVEGSPIVVNYTGLTTDPTDWIALAPAGALDGGYVAWHFQSGTGSGQETFASLPPGNYEARAYLHNSFERAGTYAFSVVSADPPSVVTGSPTYVEGDVVTVTYDHLTGNQYDWVAVSAAGSPATSYVAWTWVDPSGTSSFSNLAAGDYEARVYADNGFTVIASYAFSVAPAGPGTTIGTTSATYAAGDTVVVNFTGLGGPSDWVGIALAGSSDTEYVAYEYTTQGSGTASFSNLPAGDYEVRGYLANSYQVAVRATFSITP
jgi:hypothetical protein